MLPSLPLAPLLLLVKTKVSVASALCVVVCTVVIYRRLSTLPRIPKGLKHPPGPPGRFLVGNLLDLPTKENWKTFQRWAQAYGDLTYLSTFGTSLLFVNSSEFQHELFEKRGAIYSDRFQSTMFDLSGFNWSIVTLQYGDMLRRQRSVLHDALNKTASMQYRGTIERHARKLLLQLQETPENFLNHTRHTLGASTLEMIYGYKVKEVNDPYVEIGESALRIIGQIAQPGAFWVDFLPILRYIPSWFPGAGFKHTANRLNQHLQYIVQVPFDNVKELMKSGKAAPSIASNTLEDMQTRNDVIDCEGEEEVLRHICGSLYLAGIDTTECVFQSFFLAMILYPGAQQAAQIELDRVIGSKALPTFEDRDNLPYINALIQEILRWHPAAPCAFPHLLKQDDVIGDYFIPKGTIVMSNLWVPLHSPSMYGEDVDDFNPSRFLKGDEIVRDSDIAFGIGRRVCPGKWMVDSQLFILIASILHVFKIEPHDSEVPTKDDFVSGVLSPPKPFKCHVHPRNSEAVALLEHLRVSHEFS